MALNHDSYLSFIPSNTLPISSHEDDFWFLYIENQLLIINENDNNYRIPRTKDLDKFIETIDEKHYLGTLKDINCYCAEIITNPDNKIFSFIPLRRLSALFENDLFLCCGRAYQLLHWVHNNKYCGRCGSQTYMKTDELSRHCRSCNLTIYPRISPAIIVTVTNGDKILLAHNVNFPDGLHSNVAGFVDPCESLEECVKREVLEEVGLKVKNIRYFGNQPWPYPDSLMIGFFAEYESGDIKVDGGEITHADWYSVDDLPLLPEKTTIARKMIDTFISKVSS